LASAVLMEVHVWLRRTLQFILEHSGCASGGSRSSAGTFGRSAIGMTMCRNDMGSCFFQPADGTLGSLKFHTYLRLLLLQDVDIEILRTCQESKAPRRSH